MQVNIISKKIHINFKYSLYYKEFAQQITIVSGAMVKNMVKSQNVSNPEPTQWKKFSVFGEIKLEVIINYTMSGSYSSERLASGLVIRLIVFKLKF